MIADSFSKRSVSIEQRAKELAPRLVSQGYRERADPGLTGEWIIFAKQDNAAYYLTLANHTDGDEANLASLPSVRRAISRPANPPRESRMNQDPESPEATTHHSCNGLCLCKSKCGAAASNRALCRSSCRISGLGLCNVHRCRETASFNRKSTRLPKAASCPPLILAPRRQLTNFAGSSRSYSFFTTE
jgi:hypothetical protein